MDTPLKVVVVEDHKALREMTVLALNELGCPAVGVGSAEEVDELIGSAVDLFVIDLNLPGEDGISLLKRIRSTYLRAGVIVVSARRKEHEKLQGYESGADFYLSKPTSVDELAAVINAFRRRLQGQANQDSQQFRLNTTDLRLVGPNTSSEGILLVPHEVKILAALARASDRQLEYWQLMRKSPQAQDLISKNALEVQVVRLRKKLTQAGAGDSAIKGIRGYGYQLCIPLSLM
jgi:DNA-binding response OmpR family regulator